MTIIRKSTAFTMDYLKGMGYDEVFSLQNNSGHGIDAVAIDHKNKTVNFFEVKTSRARNFKLSKDQQGGIQFVRNRIARILGTAPKGKWKKPDPGVLKNANKVNDLINIEGYKTKGKVIKIGNIDNAENATLEVEGWFK